MDDAKLEILLQTPSLLNELANEAMICAEDIEHRILKEQDKAEGTHLAHKDRPRWHKSPPSVHEDFDDDYVMKYADRPESVPSGTSTEKRNGRQIVSPGAATI